jgi:DNA-binding winged helix-turn-helix (wHTH) protein
VREPGENQGNLPETIAAQSGRVHLVAAERRVLRNGVPVHLTPKAFDLLLVLMVDAPRVMSKEALHARLWPATFVSDATLVGLVKEVRRALDGDEPGSSCIRTVNRVGYAFAWPIDASASATAADAHWLVRRGGDLLGLQAGINQIGRDPSSVVRLDAAGVSRFHARIEVSGDAATIEDLGSKNGTRVSGERLAGRVSLRDGDRIDIGPEALVYRRSMAGISTLVIPFDDRHTPRTTAS